MAHSDYAFPHHFNLRCKVAAEDCHLTTYVPTARPTPNMPRLLRLRRPTAGRLVRRGHGMRGQSLAEFALIAPVMLGLLGIGVDFARILFSWMDLESATRDA